MHKTITYLLLLSFIITIASFFLPFFIISQPGLDGSISASSVIFTPRYFIKDSNRGPFIFLVISLFATMALPWVVIAIKRVSLKITATVVLLLSSLIHTVPAIIFMFIMIQSSYNDRWLGPAAYISIAETSLIIVVLVLLNRRRKLPRQNP
ncbi:MAG: hypothetical protein M0D57_05875 [Sphingobacteriales bacterium JAD_PAG50586_3]|nr:MAG: hypothetical protein M0D57_05875 [Sphingobacteriales bacterium JAD_PAG50586_3]